MPLVPAFLRRPSTLATVAVGAYALACVGVFWRQRELLYRAPRETQSPDLPGEVVAASAAGPALHGWVDNPGQPHAVVYFGGSSEPVELRRLALAQAFPAHTRYLVPYRGFGPNRALISGENAIKHDALRSFDRAASEHATVDVLGRSLGTGVALHVAARRAVRRLGLITPYDSILEVAQSRYRWLPVRVLLRDRFESWRDAIGVSAPIFAVLAETDPVTPHRCWENLKRHLRTPLGVRVVPGTDHTTIVDAALTWQALEDFFRPETVAATNGLPDRHG